MKTILLAFAVVTVCTHSSFSQKDAPVVGNAIELVQLLNKDYESVAPEIRGEQLIRDRAVVLDILKSYLRQLELEEYNDRLNVSLGSKNSVKGLIRSRDEAYQTYILAKEKHDLLKRVEFRGTEGLANGKNYVDQINVYNEERVNARKKYFNAQFAVDSSKFVELTNVYCDNTYLESVLNEYQKKYQALQDISRDPFADQGVSASVQKGLPFIGGDLAFETVVDGISRFLAERIKEELTTYVITEVQDWLNTQKESTPIEELAILLPTTMDYLLQFEASQMFNFPDEIKQYIEKDLNSILENMGNLREAGSIKRLLELYPDLDFAFEALDLIPKLKKIKHPVEFMEVLESSRNLNRWEASEDPIRYNISNAINLSILLGRSFTVLEGKQLEFANLEDVDLYLDNNHFFQLYFGFLFQQDAKYYQVNFKVRTANPIDSYTYDVRANVHSKDDLFAAIVGVPFMNGIIPVDRGASEIVLGTPRPLMVSFVRPEKEICKLTQKKDKKGRLIGGDWEVFQNKQLIAKVPVVSSTKNSFNIIESGPIQIYQNKELVHVIPSAFRGRIIVESKSVGTKELIVSYEEDIVYSEVLPINDLKVSRSNGELRIANRTSSVRDYHLPLGSMMQEFMNYYDGDKIVELDNARTQFETIFSDLGVQVKEVTSLAVEIRKTNKRREKVPLKMAHDFVSGSLDFTESLALSGDLVWDFLKKEIDQHGRKIEYLIEDTRDGEIRFQLNFSASGTDLDFNVALEEKVAPYLKVARGANGIVLDLHEEKYSNAILGALQLVAEVQEKNDLSELISLTNVVKEISQHGWRNSFSDIFDYIAEYSATPGAAMPPLPTKSKEIEALKNHARQLHHLLEAWEAFYLSNLIVDPVDPQWLVVRGDLEKTKRMLWNIYTWKPAAVYPLLPNAVSLFSDSYFGKIVLTYYADKSSKRFIDETIVAHLKEMTFTDREGRVHNIFSGAQIVVLETKFKKYTNKALALITSRSDKSDFNAALNTFNGAEEELFNFMLDYLGDLHTNWDIQADSPVFKLIHFLNDMSQSKSAEDVQNAIENFALPAGSFAVKRNSRWTLSIDSYPGIFVGGDHVVHKVGDAPQAKFNLGFTAPIGISSTWGTYCKSKHKARGSIGVFIPIIDVGAFTKFRFNAGDSTSVLPEFELKNIFAPGLHLTYGLPNVPVNFFVGAQYGPEIRKLDADGNIESRFEAIRWGGGLTLDIPLFNIYTKPRIYKQ